LQIPHKKEPVSCKYTFLSKGKDLIKYREFAELLKEGNDYPI
jgi:hypothetical protein